jgi:hypothetical protein
VALIGAVDARNVTVDIDIDIGELAHTYQGKTVSIFAIVGREGGRALAAPANQPRAFVPAHFPSGPVV